MKIKKYTFEEYNALPENNVELLRSADVWRTLGETDETVKNWLWEYMPEVGNLELLDEAASARGEYLSDIFGARKSDEEGADLIEIRQPFDEILHRKYMTSMILVSTMQWMHDTEREKNFQSLLDGLTKKVIETGQLEKDIRFDKKRFGAGGRLTRALNHFADITNNYEVKNRLMGNFEPQQQAETVIYASMSPYSIMAAGIYGNSCMSPDNTNSFGTPTALGYKNMFVVHDEDYNWRAWVFVDNEYKTYNLGKGYPREDYQKQVAAIKFMESMGYKQNPEHFFEMPGYMDTSTVWRTLSYSERRKFREIADSLGLPYPFAELTGASNNREAYGSFNGVLNDLGPNTAMYDNDSIVRILYCDYCGEGTLDDLDEYNRCGGCAHDYYCDRCGEPVYEEDLYYSEMQDRHLCEVCYNSDIAEAKNTTRIEATVRHLFEAIQELADKDNLDIDFLTEFDNMTPEQYDQVATYVAEWAVHTGSSIDLRNAVGEVLGRNMPWDYSSFFEVQRKLSDFYDYTWLKGEVEV